MPMLQSFNLVDPEHTQNCPRGKWPNKNNSPLDTGRQKTVSKSIIGILWRNKTKFHMYLMSWLVSVATRLHLAGKIYSSLCVTESMKLW